MMNEVQILHKMNTANMLTCFCRHVWIIRATIVPVYSLYLWSTLLLLWANTQTFLETKVGFLLFNFCNSTICPRI